MEKCICCNTERRLDRMSSHMLKKHRDNIISFAINKEMLERELKERRGYVRLYMSSLTDEKKRSSYIVSLGYNSGWTMEPIMKKTLEKIREHRDKHIEECEGLLKDINKAKEPLIEGEGTSEGTTDTKLKVEYDALLKRLAKVEKENEQLKKLNDEATDELFEAIDTHKNVMKTICRLYSIPRAIANDIAEQVNDVYRDYKGRREDEDIDEMNRRIEAIEAIE